MGSTQYAIKIRTASGGMYSVGPYDTLQEAETMAEDIAYNGNLSRLRTQKHGLLYLCDQPEVVEIIPFKMKESEPKEFD